MQEFRYGTFLRVFLFICCLGLLALFVWPILQADRHDHILYYAVILPACLAMSALTILGMIDTVIGRFIIASDRVTVRSPFGYRRLMLHEIRGFRTDENYIRIIPIDTRLKPLKVSRYFKNSSQIVSWLLDNYDNLDDLEGAEDEHEVLKNDEVGITPEQRLEKLGKARKAARIVNGIAWALMAWLFFIDLYRDYAITICCIYPLIAILVALRYRGIMSPDEYENSKLPSVATATIMPGIALALRAMIDFNILTHPLFMWAVVGCISLAITIMYMLPSFKSSMKWLRFYGTGAVMIFLNLFYGYGLTLEINCKLDQSPSTDYSTTVASKRVSNGKMTTYHLTLNRWGTLDEDKEVKVTRNEYEQIHEGDPVDVRQHEGLLKIKWVEVLL